MRQCQPDINHDPQLPWRPVLFVVVSAAGRSEGSQDGARQPAVGPHWLLKSADKSCSLPLYIHTPLPVGVKSALIFVPWQYVLCLMAGSAFCSSDAEMIRKAYVLAWQICLRASDSCHAFLREILNLCSQD